MGDIKKFHFGDISPDSKDLSMTASISNIGTIAVRRPTADSMYFLYFEDKGNVEEIGPIAGSTDVAKEEFESIASFLQDGSWKSQSEAREAVIMFIRKLHGGIAE